MSKSIFTVLDDNKSLVVKRTFSAPKESIWAAYTEADKLAKWWGPKGWETEVKEMDFRVGGPWFYAMTCKDEAQGDWFGKSSCGKGVYDAIKPQDSFSYTDYFTDEDGTITPGMPTSRTTIELMQDNGETTITSTSEFESVEALKQVLDMGMQEGFDQTWDNLEIFLNS
ncbi:MAG: activator of Hsp90 ATPase 1 family protein [Candidatus Saccharibacteria bacterium]|nr:activator of Hsp90 ATPase 1 family protein [Candidatus Saccharibacteria bacterium]